jgi:hypothetical protein
MKLNGSNASIWWISIVSRDCPISANSGTRILPPMLQLKTELELWINGRKFREQNPNPHEPLISFLRRLGLTGTKLGCSEGLKH